MLFIYGFNALDPIGVVPEETGVMLRDGSYWWIERRG
jgi:hypothetical protein